MNDKLNEDSGLLELAAIRRVQRLMAESMAGHPDFHAWMDEVDPYTACRGDLADLMDSAPSDVVRGLLFGIHMMRIQIAAVTGRAYE